WRIKEPDRWVAASHSASRSGAFRRIFAPAYRRRTLVNAGLVTVSIIGLWAAAVYEPAAIVTMAKRAGYGAAAATRLASLGSGLLSVGTCLGCLAAPLLSERLGRRWAQALYFIGM